MARNGKSDKPKAPKQTRKTKAADVASSPEVTGTETPKQAANGHPTSQHPKARSTSFKPGQSGNPAGRPKGARNRLSEKLLATLAADFEQHGAAAIIKMREEKPVDYVRTCASLVPKAFDLGNDEDDEGNKIVGVALITRTAIEAIIERGQEAGED